MHLVGNNSFVELTPLWSVGEFLHDLYAQTLSSAHDTCSNEMTCYCSNCIVLCPMTFIAARFLHPCACFNCPSSTLHPLLAYHHLYYVDKYCVCATIKQ